MKFSIGDKVLLKRTGEEGRVVAFLSKTMMEVEVNGTQFPVYNDEVEHPYLKWFTEGAKKAAQKRAAEIPAEKPKTRAPRLSRGVYLSFIPQFATGTTDDIIESFKLHLINETPDDIRFSYDARSASGESIFRHRGTLHAFGNLYLHPLVLEVLNEQPRLHWELAPIAKADARPVSDVLRIRAAQLARYIRQLLEEGQPSFNVLLTADADAGPESVTGLPELPASSASQAKSEIILHTRAEAVLDLHAKELGLNTASLSPQELLERKLALLQKKLQAALVAGLPRMVVIHGIGTGGLRNAIHQMLSETEGVAHFSNHWMGQYGWGATEIIF